MTQTQVKKTNNQWYPYEEQGCFYKLEDDVLLQAAMNGDGSIDRDGDKVNYREVDWKYGVAPGEDMKRMKEIVKELEEKE